MHSKSVLRVGIYLLGVILIVLIIALSIWRQRLYAPSSQEISMRANVSAGMRVQELREWPPAPDHPFYPFRMVGDQVQLAVASSENLPLLKLQLAQDRLASAKILLYRERTSLALTTLTKSTKYVLSAASDVQKLSPQSSSQIRGEVRNSVSVQIEELRGLKESFSDEQKPIVDRLLSELSVLQETFL